MNEKIRQKIRDSRVYQYEIADRIGITEFTFTRLLRKPLSEDQTKQILDAINSIKSEQEGKDNETVSVDK